MRLLCAVGLCTLIAPFARATLCFICGPSPSSQRTGDCKSQFQYDCNPTTLRLPGYDGRVFCKTSRVDDAQGQYSFTKECVTEDDHLLQYPDFVGRRCFQPYSNTTICVCGGNLCNADTLQVQISQDSVNPAGAGYPQIGLNTDKRPYQQPVAEFNVNANLDYFKHQQGFAQNPQLPPQHPQLHPQDTYPAPSLPASPQGRGSLEAPLGVSYQASPELTLPSTIPNKKLVRVTPLAGEFATTPSINRQIPPSAISNQAHSEDPSTFINPLLLPSQDPHQPVIAVDHDVAPGKQPMIDEQMPKDTMPRKDSMDKISNTDRYANRTSMKAFINPTTFENPLACIVCTETSATEEGQCGHHESLTCNVPNVRDVKDLRCLTRKTMLADGNSALEKFCVDVVDLASEYGPSINTTYSTSTQCYSAADGLVQFCLCSTDRCNNKAMKEQVRVHGPLVEIGLAEKKVKRLEGANYCKRCTRSNMNQPAECDTLHDFDCGQQYRNHTEVYCLTRMVKDASGRYSIERRCISHDEHQKGYPGTQVTHKGCGEAWNGHVQYCICRTDNCNMDSLWEQQAAAGFAPTELTKEPTLPQRPPQPEPEPKPRPEHKPRPGATPTVPALRVPTDTFDSYPVDKKPTEAPYWKRFNNSVGRSSAATGMILALSLLALF